LERGTPLTGPVSLSEASPSQRDAVERLLGRRPRTSVGLTVRLEDLDEVLRTCGAHPGGLAAAVVALTGPVVDRVGEAARQAAAWDAVYAPLVDLAAGRPPLAPWVDGVRAAGTLRRLAGAPGPAQSLVSELVRVLAELPAEPEPVGRFAERVLGSAHALDPDRPLTGLLFGAVRALGGVGDGEGAAWRRDVWASVGLLRDELSSTVLSLGLPGAATPTGRMLGALADAGEPAVLTLRQLRQPPPWELTGVTVSVCENPVVVAEAAERLGPLAAPLICVGGQPGAAAMTLLRAVLRAGATLRYHGDFDWGGLRIGNVLFARVPLTPWRFDTAAYESARRGGQGVPLRGEACRCSWDPDLTAAMLDHGHAVEEERVLDDLVGDLAPVADG
jgi:uncharacterized protein (TIGR02679 family)